MKKKYKQVKDDFLIGKYKGCREFFEKNGYFIEAGYCYLIIDKIEKARICFEKMYNIDIRAHWGIMLIQMITGKISMVPTYFEVRNFLEIDLDIFIVYGKKHLVEKVIRYCDFMAIYNLECYKFIARAFWSHKMLMPAMFFLNKAKEKLFNDPELHYLLAYIYYSEYKDLNQCLKEINTCLNILPEYAPARMLQNRISN